MSEEKNEKKSFTVRDRRFSPTENRPSDNRETPDIENEAAEKSKKRMPGTSDFAGLPKVGFMTFIMSLNASAMVHLGIIDDPGTGEKSKNLALGKQTIDILGMLEEKTRGNLNDDEERMLKNILYDLRILYIKEKS
ncbi:MAG: DUF1844 domain-containing protein [Desulfobacterales bacterium]